MRKSLVLFLLAMALFLSSCKATRPSPEYTNLTEKTTYSVLKFPPVKFDDIIWRTDGILLTMQYGRRQPYALEGDDGLRYLDLEQDSKCNLSTNYRYPTQLPDGRLGLLKMCATDNTFTDKTYMVAYNWNTSQLDQIVQNPLKHFNISECFSWNPDMTRGIQEVSDGLTGTLSWLTQVGPEPVHITLRDGSRVWNLSQDYEENGSTEGGRTSCPSWSPKGDKIAVFVSFDAMGVKGIARLDKQTQLILFSPETGESESVLSGIYYPEFIEWSPDGESIAFVGDRTKELWVFNVETPSLFLIDKGGEFDDLSWSPDSRHIAIIWCDEQDCEKSEIRQYTLPK